MAFNIIGRVRNFMRSLMNNRAAAVKSFHTDTALSDQMEREIERWYNMYMDRPEWMSDRVYPLGLPRAISREFSRVVTSELNINIDGSQRAEYLKGQIDPVLSRIYDSIEVGVALGGLAFKPYVAGDSAMYIGLDICSATAFIPVQFDDGGICTAGIFKSKPVKYKGNWFVKMEYHTFDHSSGTYTIQNKAFRSSEQGEAGVEATLNDVPAWQSIQPEVVINDVTQPLFGYFAAPAANTVSLDSNIGVSIYAGATEDLIKEADRQWERYIWEYESAERKIIGTPEAVAGDLIGHTENPLKHDRLFVQMPYDSDEFFHEFSPALRDSGYYDGLQAVLKRIEFNTGLSYGDLSDPSSVEKSATEVEQAKNRKYNTVHNIEKRLEVALRYAVYGMDVYATLYHLAPKGDYDLQITFDDSILEDSTVERARDLQEVNAGLMAKYEYRMKWYGEDEETAKAAISNISSGDTGFEGVTFSA